MPATRSARRRRCGGRSTWCAAKTRRSKKCPVRASPASKSCRLQATPPRKRGSASMRPANSPASPSATARPDFGLTCASRSVTPVDGTACQVEPETCRLQQSELPPDITLEPAILIILDGQQLEQGECALEQARLRLALGQRAVEQGTGRGKAGEAADRREIAPAPTCQARASSGQAVREARAP